MSLVILGLAGICIKRESLTMYGFLFRRVLYPFYETVLRRRPTLRHLAVLEKQQWFSQDEIEQIQWQKLVRLLRHTYEKVPFYRRQWDQLGAHPNDILTRQDFAKLPILTKGQIRRHAHELQAEDYLGRNTIRSGTGGSTGESLRFSYARDSYEWRVASAARSDRWVGWDWACKEAYIWGLPLVAGPCLERCKKKIYHALQRRRIFNSYEFSEETLPKVAADLAAFRPNIIVAYANPLYFLSRFVLEHGISLPSPRAVIATAEMLYEHQRQVIEDAFHCKVFNRYGCREVMLIAAQCECQQDLHINADNIYVEFVHEDGSPCAPEETGIILLTDLNNYGMPFIRYQVGDLGAPANKTCPCGRNLPVMGCLQGRTLDIIHLPNGRHLTGLFFTHLLLMNDFPGLESFQFEQVRPDHVRARIVRGPGWKNASIDIMRRIIHQNLGDAMSVSFEFPDKIPLTRSGKWRPVIGLPQTQTGPVTRATEISGGSWNHYA